MGLINCKECNRAVSDLAKACPGCGAPVDHPPSTAGSIAMIGMVILACFFLLLFLGSRADSSAGAAKTPASIQEQNDIDKAVAALRHLRERSKNPASFEVVSVTMTEAYIICVSFRGRNSFNAVVPGRAVISGNMSSNSDADWLQFCADKPGKDLTSAKYAL